MSADNRASLTTDRRAFNVAVNVLTARRPCRATYDAQFGAVVLRALVNGPCHSE